MKLAILPHKPTLYSTRRIVEVGKQIGVEISVIDHFICKIIIERNKPPKGSFRSTAIAMNQTILAYESGESLRIEEPSIKEALKGGQKNIKPFNND